MRVRVVIAVAAMLLPAFPCTVRAGQPKAPLSVTATVVPDCTIEVDTAIDMPDYSYVGNLNQDDEGEGEGHIVCTKGFFPKSFEFCDEQGGGLGGEYLADFGLQIDLKLTFASGWGNTSGTSAYFNILADAAAGQNPPLGRYFGSTYLKADF